MSKVKEASVQEKHYIVLTFRFERVDRRWLARCEELGTSTFGRSLTEAQGRLTEAVWLHLNTLEDVGERERFFKEHGILFHHAKPPRSVDLSKVPVNEQIFIQPHVQRLPALVPA